MEILIINGEQVRQLLPMDVCIDLVADALKALGHGEAINSLRPVMMLPDNNGVFILMPAYMGNLDALGVKVISVMPGNHGTEFDSHQGAVLLFDATRGRLLAVIDASEVTAIRTAAASGVATRLLARDDANDLAILGSGVQARSNLEAMLVTRDVRRVRVWSRNPANAHQFAEREGQRHGIAIETAETAQEAVIGASIICTTTSSSEPVLQGAWLAPGAHLNVVGASVPSAREVDTEAMVRSRLFVDCRESTLNEAGDFLIPKQEGAVDEDHIQAELGEILLGQHPGRESRDEITLFKSLGLGVEDVVSAAHIYHQAIEQGIGTAVEFGGERHN